MPSSSVAPPEQRKRVATWGTLLALCVGLAVVVGQPQTSLANPLSPSTLARGAVQPELLAVHCCHAHPLPPYDRYCCHGSGVYVAPRAYVGPTYAGSVRRQSRRVSRRTSRRVSRRR